MNLKIRGKKKLQGEIRITGAKNSAVAVIPAAILCDEDVTLRNIPDISDVRTLIDILNSMGYKTHFDKNSLLIKGQKKISSSLMDERIKNLRGSYYFYGAFLGKCGQIKTYLPGGCKIGKRPINYHLEGFKSLNCSYFIDYDTIEIKTKKLIGNHIQLKYPSVGATINILLASVRAKGTTVISNCAKEPEVDDVCHFLVQMGAIIKGIGTDRLEIEGVKKLHGVDYKIINDRIEAGSYLILGSICKGTGITVNGINKEHLSAVIETLLKIGINLEIKDNSIKVTRPDKLNPVDVVTGPYPQFPTDLAQPLTSLLISIEGTSSVTEEIFENRFSHIDELNKMGSNITLDGQKYYITGFTQLKPTTVKAYDLRGSFALIIASLQTYGITTIENIKYLFRGYDEPLEKLKHIGVNLELED